MSHLKIIPGKDVNNDPNDPKDVTNIEFEIQDDGKVSGYGMPVTKRLCRKMINDYHLLQSETYAALDKLTGLDSIEKLKDSIHADKEIIAGIYGRDTLLHLLEQEGCEGIMYITCMYGGQKSVVLMGVDKDGFPVSGKDSLQTDENTGAGNAVIYEVKGGGKTRAEINVLIPSGTKAL